jgi:CubicO group peptidase (beta-lactamase class C family)
MTDEAALAPGRLARLGAVLTGEVDAGRLPGAVVGIVRDGRPAYLEVFGYRDVGAGVPMTPDTLFWVASMTKPVTTVGALALHEQGRLDLGAPVSAYLPDFAGKRVGAGTGAPARRQPLVLDLLRHTSGMVEGMLGDSAVHRLYEDAVGDGMTPYTGAEFAARLAPLPLLHEPGERWHYGWGLDLIGLIIEGITGRPLREHLAEVVFSPLGMADTSFGVPAGAEDRYARALPTDPDTGRPQALPDLGRARFDSGGAGLVSTAPDYLRFVQLLLDGGRSGGQRLLGRKTVEFMTTNQLAPGTDTATLAALEPGYDGFGLGVAVRTAVGNAPTAGSAGEVTWGGAGGTLWWADPAERLGVVFLAHTPNPGTARRYHRLVRSLVLAAVEP